MAACEDGIGKKTNKGKNKQTRNLPEREGRHTRPLSRLVPFKRAEGSDLQRNVSATERQESAVGGVSVRRRERQEELRLLPHQRRRCLKMRLCRSRLINRWRRLIWEDGGATCQMLRPRVGPVSWLAPGAEATKAGRSCTRTSGEYTGDIKNSQDVA